MKLSLSKKAKQRIGIGVAGALAYLAFGAFYTYQETGEGKALLQPMNILAWPWLLLTNGDVALDANSSVSSSWGKLFGGQS